MDRKKEYLVIIQGVIARMANNSFLLKGWSVTLVSALFALAARDANKNFVFVALIPIGVFWGLDAYYLRQERLFRHLYDRARTIEENEIDFSLDMTLVQNMEGKIIPVWSLLLVMFYGALVLSTLVVHFFLLP